MKKVNLILVLVLLIISAKLSGQEWTEISTGYTNMSDIYFASNYTGYIVGSSGLVLKSSDAGETWSQQSSNTTANLVSVFFTDFQNGWACGGNTIIKTSDGGVTWTASTLSGQDLYAIHFIDVNNGWVVGQSGIIFKTTNGGSNWNQVSSPTSNKLTDVHFEDASRGYIVAGGTSGTFYHTLDGGSTWYAPDTYPSDGADMNKMQFIDYNTGFVAGRYYNSGTGKYEPRLYKTTNGGEIFTDISPGATISSNGVYLRDVYFLDANTGYVVGATSTDNMPIIIKTTNGGSLWVVVFNEYIGGGSDDFTSICFSSNLTGFAIASKGFFKKQSVPLAPTNLAVSSGSDYAYLTWDEPGGWADNFTIERSLNNTSNFTQIASGITALEYTDNGLAGGIYYYRVKGCNSNGCSSYSEISSPITIASPSLSISETSLVFEATNAPDQTVIVTSNTDWEVIANGSPDWISGLGWTGSGDNQFTVEVSDNTSTSQRTATLTVQTTDGSNIQETLNITQNGLAQTICFSPRLVLPRNNSVDIASYTQFEWERVEGESVTYELEIQDATGSVIQTISDISDTRYRLSGDEVLTSGEITYQYRIRANVSGINTNWSDLRTFTTLNSSTTWANGNPLGHWNNVVVYSNDGRPTSNYSCNNGPYCSEISGINTGLKWECTEYTRRYYYQVYGIDLQGVGITGSAKDFYGNASIAGLLSYASGSTELPQVGDLVCWTSTSNGHVGIVSATNYSNPNDLSVELYQQHHNTYTIGNYIDHPRDITAVGDGYKIVYVGGQNGYQGFLRANPEIYYPHDGDVIAETTPTFRWENMPSDNFTIYIQEKDESGCYQDFHNFTGTGNSYYLSPANQLTPGNEYLFRLVNYLPSGVVMNRIYYFTVSASKSGETEEVLPTELFVSTIDNEQNRISNIRIFTMSNSVWKDRGLTNSSGNLYINSFEHIAEGDILKAFCDGYETQLISVTSEMLENKELIIEMTPETGTEFIINPNISIIEDGIINNSQVFTNPDAQLKITALNHSDYYLGLKTSQNEDDENFINYNASSEIVDYEFSVGANNIVVVYANSTDTLVYSKLVYYIPEAQLEDTTYNVTVISDLNSIGSKVFIDGEYIKTIENANEEFTVFNGTREFSFTKNDYVAYFEITNDETTIDLSLQPTSINSIFNQNQILVYPNPANDLLTVNFGTTLNNNTEIILFDFMGRKIKTISTVGQREIQINTSDLTNGVYYINLLIDNEKSVTKIIIIMK